MIRLVRKRKVFISVMLMCVAMITTGCENPYNMPPAQEAVFQGMKAVGFQFDATLVEIEGEMGDKAVVSGPMIGLKEIPEYGAKIPRKGSDNFTRYRQVELSKQGDKWIVTHTVLRNN